MVISFLDPFCRKILPRNYRRKRPQGSWLAVGPKEEEQELVVTIKPMPSAEERWNRKGLVTSSYQYGWERSGKYDKYKASGQTNAAASRFSPSPSGMSDWSTAACTRETPSPDRRPETPDDGGGTPCRYPAEGPNSKDAQQIIEEDPALLAIREALEKAEHDKQMKWLLMHRGRDMSEEEYNTLVLDTMKPKKRSKSKYESCLLPDRVRQHPKQVAHHAVYQRLEDDKKNYDHKYDLTLREHSEEALAEVVSHLPSKPCCEVVSQAWKRPTSSYSIGMCSGNQHDKFTRIEYHDPTKYNSKDGSSRLSSKSLQSHKLKEQMNNPKFNLKTIRKWFSSIDVENTGMVTRRQMINALWHNDHICEIFSKAVGVETPSKKKEHGLDSHNFDDLKREMSQQYHDMGANDSDIESVYSGNYAEDKAEELRVIAKILRDIDHNRSGTLAWEEIVEFFRRTGHLLEYQTEQGKVEITSLWMDATYQSRLKEEAEEVDLDLGSPSPMTSMMSTASKKSQETRQRDAQRRLESWALKPQAQNSRGMKSGPISGMARSSMMSMDLAVGKQTSDMIGVGHTNSMNFGMMRVNEKDDPTVVSIDLAQTIDPGMLNSDRPSSAGSDTRGRGHRGFFD